MIEYPLLNIVLAAAVSLGLATGVGHGLARLGFPLPTQNRFQALDGLRGYLALFVLFHHFIIWLQMTRLDRGWTPPPVFAFNQFGAGAVALFFMATGFLFYPRVQAGWRAVRWRGFLVQRFFRIQPMVTASVVMVAIIAGVRQGAWPGPDFPKAIAVWLVTWGTPDLMGAPDSGRINAYVLWSLFYEWQFYLITLPLCALARDGLWRWRVMGFARWRVMGFARWRVTGFGAGGCRPGSCPVRCWFLGGYI